MGPVFSKNCENKQQQLKNRNICPSEKAENEAKFKPPTTISVPPHFNFSDQPLQGLGPFEPQQKPCTGFHSSDRDSDQSIQNNWKVVQPFPTTNNNPPSQESVSSNVNYLKFAQKAKAETQSSLEFTTGATAASIFPKPSNPSPQMPELLKSISFNKEQKDQLHSQEKVASQKSSTVIFSQPPKTINPPEDGSKCFQHPAKEVFTAVEKRPEHPNNTGKEAKETHHSHLAKPNLKAAKVLSKLKTTGSQLLEVKISSSEDSLDVATSPINCQASGDLSTNIQFILPCERKIPFLDRTKAVMKKYCKKKQQQNKAKLKALSRTTKKDVTNTDLTEKQRVGSVLTPGFKVCNESSWHPFTVDHSCPTKAHHKHNPGRGLSTNVQKW